MDRKRLHCGLFVLLCAVAALSVACAAKNRPTALEFTVTFADARGLRPGQLVVYKGTRIGEVHSVNLGAQRVEVVVRIDAEHRYRVYREAKFTIEKPGGWLDVSGERQLTVDDRNSLSRTAVATGDIIEGDEGLWNRMAKKAGAAADWMTATASSVWKQLSEAFDQNDPDGFVVAFRDLVEVASTWTHEEWEGFRRDEYPALRDRALEVRRQFREQGRNEASEKWWTEFTAFADKVLAMK